MSLIQWVSHISIGGLPSKRFAMADTGATNHMLLKKAAFISYKLVSNLQVRMGNNLSFRFRVVVLLLSPSTVSSSSGTPYTSLVL